MNKFTSFSVALLSLSLMACTSEVENVSVPIKAVKTLTMENASNTATRTISGTLDSASTTDLSFRVGGSIEYLAVQAGDTVVADEVLAKVTQKDYKLKLDSAQARMNSARANYSEKKNELERQKKLYEQGFVAIAAVEQAQAAFNQASSDVAVAEADLNSAKNDLSYTVLKSPVTGTVAARLVEPYAEVSAGQTIYEVQAGDDIEANVLVPETMINDIGFGDAVSVSVPSVNVENIVGTISEIGNVTSGANAFSVSVLISQPPDTLRPGMSARVGFNKLSSDKGVFLVPISAIDTRIRANSNPSGERVASVFLLEDGVAVRKQISIEELDGNSLQVTDGLSIGDKLIVAGVAYIDEGQQVKEWKPLYNLPAVIKR